MKAVLLTYILFAFFHTLTLAYKAGVFEFYSKAFDTPQDTILKNLQEYESFADTAKKQSAEIIVFPEYGLTTRVSDPTEYAIEIFNTSDVIKRLANMASSRQIYVVVNLLERVKDKNTIKYYNTNLVFNRNGEIILKYQKINLFNEDQLTPGKLNQIVTFETDFGSTFGIFTSYDILFENPSRRVLENDRVTDIAYPTALQASLPFFSALTVQQGYSLANGVNLLAAGYNNPSEGYGGSGIYLYNGKIAESYIADSPSNKPIVRDVTKIDRRFDTTICPLNIPYGLPSDVDRSNVTNYIPRKDFDASKYKFQNVDLSKRNSTINLCQGDLCCTFDIVLAQDSVSSSDRYKVMVFNGNGNYNNTNHQLRICSILACETDLPETCGNKLNSTNTKFTKLTVKGNLENDDTFYVPITIDTNLLPIREAYYCNKNNNTEMGMSFVQLTTIKAPENVLVFGILGKSTASSVQAFGVLCLITICIIKSFVF